MKFLRSPTHRPDSRDDMIDSASSKSVIRSTSTERLDGIGYVTTLPESNRRVSLSQEVHAMYTAPFASGRPSVIEMHAGAFIEMHFSMQPSMSSTKRRGYVTCRRHT